MCVSKSWCLIIRSPHFFSHAFRRHPNGGLLISLLQRGETLSGAQLSFHYSPLKTHPNSEPEPEPELEPEPFFCRFKVPPPSSSFSNYYCYKGVTQVVDGLVCFYDTVNHVYVSNVCSGEIMRLPDSELLISEDIVQYNYYLGFDKVNTVYKLLKWSLISRRRYVICTKGEARSTHVKRFKIPDCNSGDYCKECEILTLGHGRWRKLDVSDATFLPLMFDTQSFCVDGFLYWFSERSGLVRGRELIAFDLNKEKFGFIDWQRILYGSRTLYTLHSYRFGQFMGRLAMFSSNQHIDPSLQIDTFEFEDFETGQYKWMRHIIKLQVEIGRYSGDIVPDGNLPTDEILLADLRPFSKVRWGSLT